MIGTRTLFLDESKGHLIIVCEHFSTDAVERTVNLRLSYTHRVLVGQPIGSSHLTVERNLCIFPISGCIQGQMSRRCPRLNYRSRSILVHHEARNCRILYSAGTFGLNRDRGAPLIDGLRKGIKMSGKFIAKLEIAVTEIAKRCHSRFLSKSRMSIELGNCILEGPVM
ncbi:hypothetical protein OG21DRAFT_671339 [Imleria badia]|nr:hypothetical protein OG21DRAFT_671339 [Imleria badia]